MVDPAKDDDVPIGRFVVDGSVDCEVGSCVTLFGIVTDEDDAVEVVDDCPATTVEIVYLSGDFFGASGCATAAEVMEGKHM